MHRVDFEFEEFLIAEALCLALHRPHLVTVHGHVDGPELPRFGVAIFPGHMAVQGLGT